LYRFKDNTVVFRWAKNELKPVADAQAQKIVDFLTDGAFTDYITVRRNLDSSRFPEHRKHVYQQLSSGDCGISENRRLVPGEIPAQHDGDSRPALNEEIEKTLRECEEIKRSLGQTQSTGLNDTEVATQSSERRAKRVVLPEHEPDIDF